MRQVLAEFAPESMDDGTLLEVVEELAAQGVGDAAALQAALEELRPRLQRELETLAAEGKVSGGTRQAIPPPPPPICQC
eukprot:SAG31_NODE_17193_length_679_cov_1.639655_2_plen_79_part_00